MKTNMFPGRCPMCGGTKQAGRTTFTVDLGFGVVVVRDVPAKVCGQCGTDWIEDSIASKLEEIVDDARKKHHMVEITSMVVGS
jgi:YgiT-type zinc finger domain-containing protein